MPEIRKDPVTQAWIIIATERARRPDDFKTESKQEDPEHCPFCEGNEQMTPPELFSYRKGDSGKDQPGWWIRGFPNATPVLRIEGDIGSRGFGLFDYMNGIGAHEIIVETPYHHDNFATMDTNQTEKIFWAYRDRIMDLKKDSRFRYVLVFKNQGPLSGTSNISHPFSQLIALPVTPKKIKEELDGARLHYQLKERCIFCDIISQELMTRKRVVVENEKIVAIMPYAPRFPFETWILPKEHSDDFTMVGKEEIMALADITKKFFSKLYKVLGNPSYNWILHDVPNKIPQEGYWQTIKHDFHWHFEVIPRITKVAGFEWGTGFYINPMPPEIAAEALRNA
ncbi:MAG: galactose-1-phosphate uridylyltransferase [bacterium]|nr:galactose-1-phosphate uridylyltransferase [bacterium]